VNSLTVFYVSSIVARHTLNHPLHSYISIKCLILDLFSYWRPARTDLVYQTLPVRYTWRTGQKSQMRWTWIKTRRCTSRPENLSVVHLKIWNVRNNFLSKMFICQYQRITHKLNKWKHCFIFPVSCLCTTFCQHVSE